MAIDTIIDDGMLGYSETGRTASSAGDGWRNGVGTHGYLGDYRPYPTGLGDGVATWQFSNLEPGTYNVYATWAEGSNRASNVPYTILGGAQAIITRVNQAAAPGGFDGRWSFLSSVTVAGTSLEVDLSTDGATAGPAGSANGPGPYGQAKYIIADAVRVVQVSPSTTINIGDAPAVTEGAVGTTLPVVFPVTISSGATQEVTVAWSAASGSATSGSDFQATSGTLTFPVGTTSQNITVLVNGDALDEINEQFVVNLTNPVHSVIGDGQGNAVIADDDGPTISFDVVSITTAEGSDNATNGTATHNVTLSVSLSAVSPQLVTVDYATANGADAPPVGGATAPQDYQTRTGTLSFANTVGPLEFTIPIVEDLLDEEDVEKFMVNLLNPVNATLNNDKKQAVITINDDDAKPTVSIDGAANVEVQEGSGGFTNVVFDVKLSAKSGLPVKVVYATSDGPGDDDHTAKSSNAGAPGTDYLSASGTLTFAPNTDLQRVTVSVRGDFYDEENEKFTFTLSNPTNATLGAQSEVTRTIMDDDEPPVISISPTYALFEGDAGFQYAVFIVTSFGLSSKPFVVNYETNATPGGNAIAGDDYEATSGTLDFSPGTTALPVSVKVNGDTEDEDNEQFQVDISLPPTTVASLSGADVGVATIIDDDPRVSINSVSEWEGNGGLTPFVFMISLSSVSTRDTVVHYKTANGSATTADTDCGAVTSSVTITAGNSNAQITVHAHGDTKHESDESFYVDITSVSDNALIDASASRGTGLIKNDDELPKISITGPIASVTEGGQATFTVTMTGWSDQAVTVQFDTYDGTAKASGTGPAENDYVAKSQVITFAANTMPSSQSINVQVQDDELDEASEDFYAALSDVSSSATIDSSADYATAIISDNDPAPVVSISNSAPDPLGEGDFPTPYAAAGIFTVSLDNASSRDVVVKISTESGTATEDVDFLALNSLEVTIPKGQTSATFTVSVKGDTAIEQDETFYAYIEANTTFATVSEVHGQAQATIKDDDESQSADKGSITTTSGKLTLSNGMYWLMDSSQCACQCVGPVQGGDESATQTELPATSTGGSLKPSVSANLYLPLGQTVPSRISAQLTFNTTSIGDIDPAVGAEEFFETTGMTAGSLVKINASADVSLLKTGRYEYRMDVFFDGSLVTSTTGFREIVNNLDSQYGANRTIRSEDRLYVYDDGVSLIRGDQTAAWFAQNGGNWVAPPGSFDALTQSSVDSSYTLTHPDGSSEEFNEDGLMTARVDRSRNRTTYVHIDTDSDGHQDALYQIIDPFGRTTTYERNSEGLVYRITDFAGRQTLFTYAGRLLQSVVSPDPDGSDDEVAPEVRYEYVNNLVTKVRVRTGLSSFDDTTILYDFAGRVSGSINPDGTSWSLVSADTKGLVDLNTIGYDSAHPAPASKLSAVKQAVFVNERGYPTTYTLDRFGQTITSTDAFLKTTQWVRNSDGLVTAKIEPDPDGLGPLAADGPITTSYSYDSHGNLVQTSYPDGGIEQWTYQFTSHGDDLIAYEDQVHRVTEYTYDPVTGQLASTTDPTDAYTHTTYTDGTGVLPAGLVTADFDGNDNETRYEYVTTPGPNFGRLTKITYAYGTTDEAFRQFEYDTLGNQSAVIDEMGRRTEYFYDQLDRLKQTTEASPDGSAIHPITTYTYDPKGNRLSTKDPLGNTTTYAYDWRNGVTTMTQPAVSYVESGTAIVIDRGAAGYVETGSGWANGTGTGLGYGGNYRTNPAGGGATATWTATGLAMGQLYEVLVTWPGGTNRASNAPFTIQNGANSNTIEVDQTQQPSDIRDGVAWQSLGLVTYSGGTLSIKITDAANATIIADAVRIVPVALNSASSPVTTYVYDEVGNQISVSDPLGRVTSYEYDALDRRTRMIEPAVLVESPAVIIDDRDAGYQEAAPGAGTWNNGTGVGYDGDYRTRPAGTGQYAANWTFAGLVDGANYEVFVTWLAGTNRATNAPFTVNRGGGQTSTFAINQMLAPNQTIDGTKWQSLGVFEVSGNTLSVKLTDAANNYVIADAVRIVRKDLIHPTTIYSYEADCGCSVSTPSVQSVTDPNGNKTTYHYDAMHRLIETVLPDPDGALPTLASPVISYIYNTAGELISETDPLLRSTTYEYDGAGRQKKVTLPDIDPTDANPAPFAVTTYDDAGNVVAVTDVLGFVTNYTLDHRNRTKLVEFPDPDGSDPLPRPTNTYVYFDDGQVQTITDQVGRVTSYEYDGLGRQKKVTLPDPDGNPAVGLAAPVTQYAYDLVGNLISQTDAAMNVIRHEYDNLYRNIRVFQPDPDGASTANGTPVTRSVYNAAGELTSVIDPLGRVTSFDYDVLGRQTQVTQPDPDGNGSLTSPLTKYIYDLMGNVLFVIDPMNSVTSFGYDKLNRRTRVTEADPDGAGPLLSPVTTFEYNAASELIKQTDPLLRTTIFSYDGLGRQIRVTLPDPDGPSGPLLSPVQKANYDAAGNLISRTDPLNNVTNCVYDALNRQTQVTQPDPDGAGVLLQPITGYAYDSAGRLAAVTDPLKRVTTYAYDNLDRQTSVVQPDPDGDGSQVSPNSAYVYDILGNVLSATDALGHAVSYTYDKLNRVVAETDALNKTTSYVFDLAGRMLSVTDPVNNKTTFTYDDLDRLTKETNHLGKARIYVYNAVGDMTKKTDRAGRVTEYYYDDLHRHIEERWKSGATTINSITYQYDAANQLLSAFDHTAGRNDYTYDNLGRVLTNVQGLPAVTVTLAQGYDAASNRTSLSASVGATSDLVNTYTYDALNRQLRVTQQGTGVAPKRVDFSYNAAGQWDSITRYKDLSATQLVATTNYDYDGTGRLTDLTHSQGSSLLAGYAYTYDAANRITSLTFADAAHSDENAVYNYDNRDQLTGANRSGTTDDESYTYDSNGNRVTANGDSYTTSSNNRLTDDGTYTYTYDDEGNRKLRTHKTSLAVTEYTYDHRNRLTNVTDRVSLGGTITMQATYTYDAFNRRVEKKVDLNGDGGLEISDSFIYDGQNIVLQFDEANVSHRYLHGPTVDQILADERVGDDVLWGLSDNLGTVRDLVDSSGDVQNHIGYDAYGKIAGETNSAIEFLFGYTGFEFDQETGLNRSETRYYDPAVGRWTQEDFIGFGGGDPNLYRYVDNALTSRVDPSGLAPQPLPAPVDPSGNPVVQEGIRDQAWVPPLSYYRNIALQSRNGRWIVQYSTVNATGGGVYHFQISIFFEPNGNCSCQEIAFIQAAKVTDKNGVPQSTGRTFRDRMTPEGWSIDREPWMLSPWYGHDDNNLPIPDKIRVPIRRQDLKNLIGAHMNDTPKAPPSGPWTWQFETVAACKDQGFFGQDQDRIYGSLHWGFRVSGGVVTAGQVYLTDLPSSTFASAMHSWNAQATRTPRQIPIPRGMLRQLQSTDRLQGIQIQGDIG